VREEAAHCYGKKGNESVAPEVIMKMMFLLFFDDITSERELMKIIAERLDYLWFLGYGLEEEIPDHRSYPKRAHGGERKSLRACLCARWHSVWKQDWSMGASFMWIPV